VTSVDTKKLPKGLTTQEVERLAEEYEKRSPQEVLAWALKTFGSRVAFSSSFGAEDVVVIDMLVKLDRRARIFTLDTLRLPKETLKVLERVQDKYGITVQVYYPDAQAVNDMVSKHGLNLFYESIENRKLCCGIRKVEPLNRALKDLDAWIAGLRRDQATTRTAVKKIEADEAHPGLIKINPLADWTWDRVWNYIRKNEVPYNELHDKNYPSIGCEPCTRAVKPGEDPRAGRWWWELDPSQKECGLHVAETHPTTTSSNGGRS
jgi:phosphoadenosine phosphosulfate reductase